MAAAVGGFKECPACKETKSVQEYISDRSRADGLRTYCKPCQTTLSAISYWDSREKRLADDKARDKGQKAACNARRYVRDRERIGKAVREWRAKNADKYRAINRRAGLNYRARKKGAFVETIDPQVVYARDHGICGICHKPIKGRFDVDHIKPVAKGGEHSYANVQATHPRCNQSKGAKYGCAA